MKILIGFERSGVLLDRLIMAGFDAYSLDTEHSLGEHPERHIQDDANEFLRSETAKSFDVAVLHPPCTRLAVVGRRWLSNPPKGKSAMQMHRELEEGAALFDLCLSYIQRLQRGAIENPPMHEEARKLIRNYRSPNQTIRPCLFGQKSMKPLSLWVHNLPLLRPTNPIKPRFKNDPEWKWTNRIGESTNQKYERSKSFEAVADQMVEQWFKSIPTM